MVAFHSIEKVPHRATVPTGGRARPRRWVRFVAAAAVLLCTPVSIAGSDDGGGQHVSVRQERGVYTVTAQFTVPQPSSVVIAVLTDYEEIPRFLPDLRKSVVLERREGHTLVEQAVARMMMFSKRVHLLLDVAHGPGEIRFRDRAAKSFTRYEGIWRVQVARGQTVVTYELTAQPSFDVPEFILGRLLERDAKRMLAGLRSEMACRASSTAQRSP